MSAKAPKAASPARIFMLEKVGKKLQGKKSLFSKRGSIKNMKLNGVFDDEILYDALIENNVEIAKQQLLLYPLDEDNVDGSIPRELVTKLDSSELLETALSIGLTLDLYLIREILENCHSKQLRFLLDKKILSTTMCFFGRPSVLYVVYCPPVKIDLFEQRKCAIMLIDAGASVEDFLVDWAYNRSLLAPPLYLEQFDKSRHHARAAAITILGLRKNKDVLRMISRLIWASRAMEAWIPTETLWQKIKRKISFF